MSTVRLRPRRRKWPFVVVGLLILLFLAFSIASQFYVDLLWYQEVNLAQVFWTTIRAKAFLGLVFGVLFFGLLYANLLIVRRLAPEFRFLDFVQEPMQRIRTDLEPYLGWLIPVISGGIALLVGLGAAAQWRTYLLWRNATGIAFGNPEQLFGRDPAYYVFTLPWLRFMQGWLFNSLVGVTILVALGHLVMGGIRPQASRLAEKVSPLVRAHLSVLLGLIMLAKAWGYYLGRFDLLTSKRGVVEGASYTDVHAQLPALNLLAIVAVICAVLFLANIRVKLWSLPVIAVALLGVVSVVVGAFVPAFVQQFSVKPNEQQRESEYVQRNIEGTRRAFGLDRIKVSEYNAKESATAQEIRDNSVTVENIRLWRPSILKQNFETLQRIRQYYDFVDVDVDRYTLSGERRVLMVSGREISPAGIEDPSWQTEHLVYTHGFGAVAAQVNTATQEGAPVFTLQDIPTRGIPVTAQPRIYYGELHDQTPGGLTDVPFVVADTKTQELDYDGAANPQNYRGTGGIEMGGFFKRALFALRFSDLNILISGQIEPTSKIMINRDIRTRASQAVPFLKFDGDPYLAIGDKSMEWIWDGYTTTSQYPYSQSIDIRAATEEDSFDPWSLGGSANYIRNSVKAVVDAYDGDVTYYADFKDPIINAWNAAFPGLLTDRKSADTGLVSHFRYPENLLQVQAAHYGRYHVTDPTAFFRGQDVWQIPDDPTQDSLVSMRPYYLLMGIPGDTEERFRLVVPFVPKNRQTMIAWMAADSDPGPDYGDVLVYNLPRDRVIEGPAQVYSRINQDPGFSTTRTLLGQTGSGVRFGDLLVIPIGQSFIYVQPVYVESASNSIPELKRVVVVNGNRVGVGITLDQALARSLPSGSSIGGGTGGGGGGGGAGGTGTTDQRVSELLTEANRHFAAAEVALRNGDLATYQSQTKAAKAAVDKALKLLTQSQATPTATPIPGP